MNPNASLLVLLALIYSPVVLAQVNCRETDATIEVTVAGKPLLTYNKATLTGPEGTEPHFARSGHIHPVHTPSGRMVSGDFPHDHLHQHALFFAWTRCEFEGQPLEFWNQKLKKGRIRHDEVLSAESGEESGGFSVRLVYEDIADPDNPRPVLHEVWTIVVHDESEGHFRFDLTSEQTCATDSPLLINEYHYGGMAMRGNNAWIDTELNDKLKTWRREQKKNPDLPAPDHERLSDFLTSEGKTARDGNHTRPKWVSLHGKVDGEPAGIAVLGHPGNFRFPQPVRLHPSMPYFCYAPMVLGEFKIEPGKPYVSRYRYVVHDGAPDAGAIDAEWGRYRDQAVGSGQ